LIAVERVFYGKVEVGATPHLSANLMRLAGYQCEQSGSHDMWQWVRILSPTFLIEEVEEHKHFEGFRVQGE